MSIYKIQNRLKGKTINQLLGDLDDYSIYCHFLGGEIALKQLIKSPIRYNDHKPTFNIYLPKDPRWEGQILFKDFNGESGNIFKFIQKYAALHENIHLDGFENIIKYIHDKFQNAGPIKKYKIENIPEHTDLTYNFQAYSKMPDTHLEYWTDLGVEPHLLDIYKTKAAQYLLDGKTHFIIKSFENTLTFGYILFDRFKLYQPFEENFKKFFNTCPRNYVQGYEQCMQQYNKPLIITKSMKDILVYQSYTEDWLDIIAPHGEGYNTSDIWLYYILQYPKIIIIYDFDLAGVKGANRLRKELQSSRFYRGQDIVCKFVDTRRIKKHGKMECPLKDIADFRLYAGNTVTRKRVNQLIYE